MRRFIRHQIPGSLAVVRLAPDAEEPLWAWNGRLSGVVRTPVVFSRVCDDSGVPHDAKAESGWTALMLEGPFPFSMIGVQESVLGPLAAAEVSVFAISSFDTDYLFIMCQQIERAVAAFEAAGHTVKGGSF